MITALGGCGTFMLECNHGREVWTNPAYAPSLKRRIGGAYGHLVKR
jgi:hypothetical protein